MSEPDIDAVVASGAAPHESSALRISLRTAAIMLAFTIVFTALMASAHLLTAPRVAASALAEKLRLIAEVLPASAHDNDLMADTIDLPPTKALGLDADSRLYRARQGSVPTALVFEATAADGYSGRIGLGRGGAPAARLLALRVTSHKETPGLGDYIEPKKDRNKAKPWITQFNGLGFDTLPADAWRVKKDGGRFDQRAGATISARAVTNASRRAMEWVVPRRDTLFSLPAGSRHME